MIALLEAKRAGLLARNSWLRNCVAGLVVGVVALPLAMAFAIASGVKPEQGIYTAIIAGLAVSLFGGSRVQIAGPTGAFIVILSSIVAQYGIQGLQVATLMAGAILLLMGVTRMGVIIKYIPVPVIIGFTAGIGVIIWVGQWQAFFGLATPTGINFHEKFWQLLSSLPQLDGATTAVAFLSLFLVIYTQRIPFLNKLPGPLMALVVLTCIQGIFQFPSVATIGSAFGEIPRGLPSFQLPQLSFARMVELIGPAFAIAMLGAIESLLSAVVADNMTQTRHNSNQELIGQGIANMLTPLFGGIAATGAIARTATNIRNGGNSPIAGIVHVLVLVLVLLLLAPLAANIPLATLAAILFVVAWNMSQPRVVWRQLKTAPRADVFILLVTFTLTVFADLVVAVNIGVVLAMLHFLKRMADSVQVQRQSTSQLNKEFASDGIQFNDEVAVLSVTGPFFFAALDALEKALDELKPSVKVVVLRLNHVPFADGTGLTALERFVQDAQAKKIKVFLSEVNPGIQKKLSRMGLVQRLGIKRVCDNVPTVMAMLDREAAESAPADAAKPAENV